MVDDRSMSGAPTTDAEVHDDDELAAALAAELERYATGAVPMIVPGAPRPSAAFRDPAPVPFVPTRFPAAFPPAEPVQPAATPAAPEQPEVEAPLPAPRAAERPAAPRPADQAGDPPTGPTDQVTRRSRAAERVVPDAAFAARVAEVQREYPENADAFRRAPERPEAPTGRRSAAVPIVEGAEPLRRRSGFRSPDTAPAPRQDALDRVLPTGPVVLPEVTGTLLDSMVSDADRQGRARHAAPFTGPELIVEAPVVDGAITQGGVAAVSTATGGTGEVAVPPPLYDDWEQSLRSIGRPGDLDDDDDDDIITGAPVDAPTVAVTVQPATPVRGTHVSGPPAEPDEPGGRAARRRRPGRRSAVAAEPATESSTDAATPSAPTTPSDPAAPVVAQPQQLVLDDGVDDDDGIDEVASSYPERRAGDTAAIDLPSIEPRPRTGPVLIERVRTAILQLPTVPPSPTGTGAPALLGRWFGAFASPLALVLAFGLAAAGAGPQSVVAMCIGVAIALPAAGRAAAWAATADDETTLLERDVLGVRAGGALAAVLLITRLFVAALLLVAVADLAGSYVTRTGVLGGNPSAAAVVAAVAVGVVALGIAAWPARVTAALVLLLGAVGVLVTSVVLLLLGPDSSGPAITPTDGGAVTAGAVAFGTIGLLLVLAGQDVVRWRTDLPRRVPTVVGVVLSAAAGLVVLGLAVAVAAGVGATGGGADAFVGAIVDATATALATPLGIALLAASVTLPALLLRSTGAAGVRLIGGGARSASLATVSAGLLAIAAALGLIAGGVDSPTLLALGGGILGVPLAAWAGVLTSAPLREGPRARGPVAAALVIAVVVGWVLADGLGSAAERSPVLDALHLSVALRGGPAIGLAAALVLGVIGGLIARLGDRGPTRRSAPAAAVASVAE